MGYKRSFVQALPEPRKYREPDRLDKLLAEVASRWRAQVPYTGLHERQLKTLVRAIEEWREPIREQLAVQPTKRLAEMTRQMLKRADPFLKKYPNEDRFLCLCVWLIPRILLSVYETTPVHLEALLKFYRINKRPPECWKFLLWSLIEDFDPYYKRHGTDIISIKRPKYDPVLLSAARLNGTGSSAYRARARDRKLNPLAIFIWKADGRDRFDPFALLVGETCRKVAAA